MFLSMVAIKMSFIYIVVASLLGGKERKEEWCFLFSVISMATVKIGVTTI